MKKITCLLSLCLCIFVCCKDDVEAVLQVAGDNRPELEKVLSHYRDEPLRPFSDREYGCPLLLWRESRGRLLS